MSEFEKNYLESIRKQFTYYRLLGDRTFSQLSEAELLQSPGSNSNSIAVIVNHLWGNMRSRWTDLFSSDGEKEWRNRDLEFADIIQNRDELIVRWNEGWDCLFKAIESIDEQNFDNTVYIRNQGHSVIEAINRQLTHYAYHVGQIVFIGRMLKGESWKSLSIPKGESKSYNQQKFSIEKHKAHFTDEYLNKEQNN